MQNALRRILIACLVSLASMGSNAKGPVIVHGNADGYLFETRKPYPAGQYFAMVCSGVSCHLQVAQVAIEPEKFVGRFDDAKGNTPGSRLSVKKPAQSLFLVRGLPRIAAGPVKTWYYNAHFQRAGEAALTELPDKRSFQRTVAIDNKQLALTASWQARSAPDCAPDCDGRQLVWKMQYGSLVRTLSVLEPDGIYGDEGMLGADDYLLWVGDLDRDGRPDLLVRPQHRPDYLEMELYLSRDIKPGQAWKAAARFYYWDPDNAGC